MHSSRYTDVGALQSVATSKHVSRLCMIRDTLRTGCSPWKCDDNRIIIIICIFLCTYIYIFYKLQWVWHNDGLLFVWIFLFIWVHEKKVLLVVELRFGWHIQLMSTLVSFFLFRNFYKANLISIPVSNFHLYRRLIKVLFEISRQWIWLIFAN